MLKRLVLVFSVAVIVVGMFAPSGSAKGSKGEPNDAFTGIVVPGPVGPDLSTPPSQNVPRTVETYSVTVEPQSGWWEEDYTWLGKSSLPDRWVFRKTVAAGYCDPSNTNPCPTTYSDSSATSGGFTYSIQFDADIVKVNTGFNIGVSVTKTNSWTVNPDPGYTGYIDEYNVFYAVNWNGRHDSYWVSCTNGLCTRSLVFTETGGGEATGTNYLAGRMYVQYGPPY